MKFRHLFFNMMPTIAGHKVQLTEEALLTVALRWDCFVSPSWIGAQFTPTDEAIEMDQFLRDHEHHAGFNEQCLYFKYLNDAVEFKLRFL